MIKFCIALALLATISLSVKCATNVILTTPYCVCTASGTSANAATDTFDASTNPPTRKYCKQVGNTYSIELFPAPSASSTTCSTAYTNLAVNKKWTGADCRIDAGFTVGNKICPQNAVYKESATACPLMPAACNAAQKKKFATVIGGDGCQCVTDKFCADTKFCYDDVCNDAAKLCSAMTATECDGLDRTEATCPDAGCDKKNVLRRFQSKFCFYNGSPDCCDCWFDDLCVITTIIEKKKT